MITSNIVIGLICFIIGFFLGENLSSRNKKKYVLSNIEYTVNQSMNVSKMTSYNTFTVGEATFEQFKEQFLQRTWYPFKSNRMEKEFFWIRDIPSLDVKNENGFKESELHASIIEFDNKRMLLSREDLDKAYLLVKEHWDNKDNPWFNSVIVSDKN